jgi:hypothetical protein
MPKISSNWKLTFSPASSPKVLLDYGDKIEGELRFPLSKGMEVVDLVDSEAPFLRDNGNNTYQIQFEVYTDEALDKTARQRVMESLIAVGAYGRAPLRIQVSGITDRYWQFANSFVREHNPGRWLDAPVARLVKGYTITATGLTQVGP